MRPVSALWRASVTTSHEVVTIIRSVYPGRDPVQVPIVSGEVKFDDTAALRRSLSISVPAVDGLDDWDPGDDPSAPLAAYGQRLVVVTGIRLPTGTAEVLLLGQYLITDWEHSEDGTIDVTAVDTAQLPADAKLYRPTCPAPGATLAGEFTRLVDGLLPVEFDPALIDRGVDPAWAWEDDRLDALQEIADAWPARWGVDDDGVLRVRPPYPPIEASDVVATLTDGRGGVVVRRSRSGSRTGLWNAVIVEGKEPEHEGEGEPPPAPWAVAEITDPHSPIRVSGPYGPVPRHHQSDLITTWDQAGQTADALLARWSTAGRVQDVEMLPDPSLETGDVVRVVLADGGAPFLGRIRTQSIPLTADGGAMTLTVSNEVPELEED